MHGLVPPHPGPLIAVDALKADRLAIAGPLR
jgi:H+/gluconate symporter-like permease